MMMVNQLRCRRLEVLQMRRKKNPALQIRLQKEKKSQVKKPASKGNPLEDIIQRYRPGRMGEVAFKETTLVVHGLLAAATMLVVFLADKQLRRWACQGTCPSL